MLNKIENSVFRVASFQGDIHGMGFLVTPETGVTNAHVVTSAQSGPGRSVTLILNNKTISGFVDDTYWDEALDVAFIHIQGSGLFPLRLSQSTDLVETKIHAYGHIANREILAEGNVRGYVSDHQNRKLIQIHSAEITTGFSGSPIINTNGCAVGMICELLSPDQHGRLNRVAYAIPIETIVDIHPAVSLPTTPYATHGLFESLIESKTKDFVGRDFLVDEVETFIKTRPSGYFMLEGVPGVGKSSFMAYLVKKYGYIHYFNIASQNIRGTEFFIENICEQLSSRFGLRAQKTVGLDHSGFLLKCLFEASRVTKNRPIVIVVDALDEVERRDLASSVNILYLPESLPEGVYFILSSRPISDYRLSVSTLYRYALSADGRQNMADINRYIQMFCQRPLIQEQLRKWNETEEEFLSELSRKSQGNFMYLHHVLPAIESGQFESSTLNDLPDGLLAYYQRHWRQMTDLPRDQYFQGFEPVVCILGVVQEPITIAQISKWTKLSEWQVKQAIKFWSEFLEEELLHNTKKYRLYHKSFQDFLKEQVDLRKYDLMIAEYYEALYQNLLGE